MNGWHLVVLIGVVGIGILLSFCMADTKPRIFLTKNSLLPVFFLIAVLAVLAVLAEFPRILKRGLTFLCQDTAALRVIHLESPTRSVWPKRNSTGKSKMTTKTTLAAIGPSLQTGGGLGGAYAGGSNYRKSGVWQ